MYKRQGQYTYCRSPQGLNSSPAYFQRLLDYVLNGISRVYVYIDDVVISVKTHEENLAKLSEVEKEAKQSPGTRERAALLFALRHWKPYLIGKEFVLRTDHKPNVAIADSKTKVYDTLSDEIMQYQPFRLEYLRGDKMFADALSRPPHVNCISIEEVKQAQRNDGYLQTLRAGKTCPTIFFSAT